MSTTVTGPRKYCTFLVGSLLYGVDVDQVQEVIRFQDMTPVPLAAAAVRGLINLRGQIVMAIDMRKRLGLGPLPEGQLPTNVVVRADGAVSLLVDEIGDVVDVNGGFEDIPDTLHGEARQLISAVCKLEGRLLLVLDVAAAINVTVGA